MKMSNKNENQKDLVLRKKSIENEDKELVEFEPKDNTVCDTEAITKDEEWITKKKTELTTTRQIETRVKRQVVLEDGKVVEDSGPIVSTNTTEDTDKQETETTEKRDLGIPNDGIIDETSGALENGSKADQQIVAISNDGGKLVKKMVPRRTDGLVREINDKRVISHEEVKDYKEIEDVKHLGDITDEVYVKAVNSGAENIEDVLICADSRQQLVPLGPRTVANTTKSFKTIDTEDVKKRCLAKDDGTLVTEKKTTTEHEIIVDRDLPEKDDHSTGSKEKIETIEASQRYFKQRDEEHVDLVANGKVIGTEMRYATETMQLEKEGSLERPGDWDSLSDRMRKLRRPQQKTLMQQHKEAALLADRKDALTKRPLDFDREEETRKGETMKWLESHFGSESTASNDSREDEAEVEPTKKTYFNVTIKSNQAQTAAAIPNGHSKPTNSYEKKYTKEVETVPPVIGSNKSKYYQGISNWADRKETSTNHFASKAFRDDLKETVERNRLKKNGLSSSRDQIAKSRYSAHQSSDDYVSREDIIHQKRQSLSSQFLARTKRSSQDKLNEINRVDSQEDMHKLHHSRTDLRYGNDIPIEPSRSNFSRPTSGINVPAKVIRNDQLDEGMKPTVPQRRRAIEKKLQQQSNVSSSSPLKVPLAHHKNQNFTEPPPDYSPPPRSRSSSPQVDYMTQPRKKDLRQPTVGYNQHAATHTENPTTLTRKQNQRTRFAPSPLTNNHYHEQQTHTMRPIMATQTTQTTPSTLSTSTAASHKSNRVGQAIGNSIRKLVNKIRSASAERKMRMKSKSKSREQSPSPQVIDKQGHHSTYQQYNVIDSHIGGQPASNDSEQESLRQESIIINSKRDSTPLQNGSKTLDRSGGSHDVFRRANSADPFMHDRDDIDQSATPRQRYYLGEDPYSSSLYGKENLYDPNSIASRRSRNVRDNENPNYVSRPIREVNNGYKRDDVDYNTQRNISSSTLGRYQKTNRYAGSTPNLNQEYRSVQTLPRKLNDHQKQPPKQSQYQKSNQRFQSYDQGYNERRPQYQQATHNLGPAKPARTYAKVLNRSKSFNVHGMNGSNDPSPIYIEKLTKNNYSNNLHYSHAYKSNPHLNSGYNDSPMGLKSPSIVNLISRSQRDLTKIDSGAHDDIYDDRSPPKHQRHAIQKEDKKQIFLKGLHQQAPELFRTLHGDEEYNTRSTSKYQLQAKHSLDSRFSMDINKSAYNSANRGSSSHDEYVPSYNISKSGDKKRGSGTTIIEVRNN